MRRFRSNPSLVVFGNPPMRLGVKMKQKVTGARVVVTGVISEAAESIAYKHVLNKKIYKHDFETPVSLIAAEMGGKRVVIIVGDNDDIWSDYPDEE